MSTSHEPALPSAPADPLLSDVLRTAASVLAAAGDPTPEVDAELLAAHVSRRSRGELAAISLRGGAFEGDLDEFESLIERRAAREPLQHLTGLAPFRHLELRVGPGVFVPRPETEMVAQLAIDALRATAEPAPIAVDLGTGSGALALAMATEVPNARVHAAENAVPAFLWAKENFAALAPAARLAFIDLASAFPDLDGRVDVLVSNPPYVPDAAIPRDPEVRFWDPPSALYGGEDGLDVVRILSDVGLRLLRPGGLIVIEHGEWQGAAIRELFTAAGWRAAATHPDLTSRDRATTALRP
ncbi:peptide chain release factor N(5)-glutamine methyltransferase [Microbacterium dextranolyticum]|uniref:Release factor glutamine methyltransferase n=1 Tax=Microbacterium dextranolyticum TaxID=36806 RepID=A0A9W6HPH3_9MICO|nr:peptide chain release factor N(5)-glutamine methyltransferase [Microbacterium dextranolyticum]MBM7463648.1 release factor glutamine methyltransferase [Microbacterium dextranolyticum]GLJ96521.1 release factor glutamine methyltransferase [Microbacterium dextranolyticum]